MAENICHAPLRLERDAYAARLYGHPREELRYAARVSAWIPKNSMAQGRTQHPASEASGGVGRVGRMEAG